MNSLTIVCGSPAAGKSTYARKLAYESRALLLDIDTCTERLVRTVLSESGRNSDDRDSQYFKETYRSPIYDTLFAIAKENISNISVIIVGPFTQEIKSQQWPKSLEKEFNLKPSIHFIYCEPNLRRDRMSKRANERDISKLDNWEQYLEYYDGDVRPGFEHIYVDSSE